MKIWLDDVRTPPDDGWEWVTDAYGCINLLIFNSVSHISFDHDLGEIDVGKYPSNTGYSVAKFIEEMANDKECHFPPITWDIHSQNPVGRKNIEMAMKSAERFWNV